MPRRFTQYGSFASVFDPLTITGLELYLNRNTLSVSPVSNWIGQSVNAFNFPQAIITKQPVLDTNLVNFDGNDDILVNATPNVFGSDAKGIFFFSGYFDNTGTNYVFTTTDTSVNGWNYFRIQISNLGTVLLLMNDGVTGQVGISSTTTLSNGAYYYGYVMSDGVIWSMNLNGSAETVGVVGGSGNAGFWMDSIPSRDNMAIGGWQRLTPAFGYAMSNKLIYSNALLTAQEKTDIDNFMSNPVL